MTLSMSRQQFLAYESQTPEDLQYGRKGGIFVSNCICISFIIFAVIVAVIVGVIVHFITYFKLSQNTVDFWDETEPFGQTGPASPNLRLPSDVVPSFYRLKLKVNLDNSTFSGDVYITIRASKAVREIILHSKNLSISSNAKLTEQIYERLETLHTSKAKRDVSAVNVTEIIHNVTTVAPSTTENITVSISTNTIQSTNTTPTVPTTTHFTPMSLDTQVTHSSVRSIRILSIDEGTGDRLILLLESSLKRDVDYILQLSFRGAISNSLTGFYKSSYTNSKQEVKNLAVTQFEPTSARTAFPCFDEPAFKAKFEISIAHPESVKALSNMKTYMEEPIIDQPGWQWTHFERSVRMSTYLVAYVLTDFKSLETSYFSKDNISKAVRVWTRPEWISKAKYALDITPKLLAYYEEVFGVPYALEKLDLIAVPDFSSDAMENWGLITFRETALLLNETETTPRDKQTVAIDIAHELAHQWFGNLVTMRWWSDLWLNEGFATYIEYVGVNRIAPQWEIFESFSRDKMDLLRTDALKNTSPVSRKVVDASEISQKFDEISYNKGANLIRILNHTITEELFHKGLVIYLNDWKYSNAEETDLWQAMSKATQSEPGYKDLSVVDFMNTWTKQAGYPVVSVSRNYETGAVVFEQRLFTTAKDPYQKMIDQLWHIPISYAIVGTSPSSWSTKPQTWLKDRFTVVNIPINGTQALYVNVDAIGYYRVNYDQKNWQLLSEALKKGQIKSPITKSQLIDDAFNFAKISQLNYSYALGLTTCVINGEDSKMVWDQLLNNMVFLKYNLKSTAGYIYFQDYVKIILKTQLKKVNYGLDKPRDDNEAFLIENLVMWECYVESPRCLRWARDQFDNWTRQTDLSNNPIPSYLRSLVYNMVVRYGGRSEFEFLWNVFLNSSDPSVKSLIINNLPATREESLITLLLERSLSELPKQYAVAAWSVEPPMGTRIAQDFLVNNFERVYDTFTDIDAFMFPVVLGGAFGFIATSEELDRLKTLALKHKAQLQPMSQLLQKIVDAAALRIDWARKHAAGISAWFKEYLTKSSPEINKPASTWSPASASTRNITAADDVTTPPVLSNTTPTTLNTTTTVHG